MSNVSHADWTVSHAALLALVAGGVHLTCDLAASLLPGATPPYLLLPYAPEPFQALSPVAVSIAASVVNGIIAAIALAAIEPAPSRSPGRQVMVLAAVLFAFWMLSGTLTAVVWLTGAGWRVAGALALGAPRALLVAGVLVWLRGRRSEG
jgi:hypothetical protein